MTDRWTAAMVEERMAAAASALTRSRSAATGPAALRTLWPDMLAERATAYGYTAAEAPKILPSSGELTALDQVLAWVSRYLSRETCIASGLAEDAGWIAWCRAQGMSLPKISEKRGAVWRGRKAPGGNSREAVRRIAGQAYEHVAKALNRERVPLHVGEAAGRYEPAPVATGRREAMPRAMDARRWVMNRQPCGRCRHMQTDKAKASWCGTRGGAVTPSLRAQHPEGAPCFEEAMP